MVAVLVILSTRDKLEQSRKESVFSLNEKSSPQSWAFADLAPSQQHCLGPLGSIGWLEVGYVWSFQNFNNSYNSQFAVFVLAIQDVSFWLKQPHLFHSTIIELTAPSGTVRPNIFTLSQVVLVISFLSDQEKSNYHRTSTMKMSSTGLWTRL